MKKANAGRRGTALNEITLRRYYALTHPVHIAILYGLFLALLSGWGELYRTFQYANIISVLVLLYGEERHAAKRLFSVMLLPLGLGVLHCLAVGEVELAKPIRHMITACFVVIGVALIDANDRAWLWARKVVLLIVPAAVYFVLQMFALLVLDREFAWTENPHYLGYYSALLGLMCLMILPRARAVRALVMVLLACLMVLCVLSYSRPTWLALALSVLLLPFVVPRFTRLGVVAVLVPIVFALFFFDSKELALQADYLIGQLSQDQRIGVWFDSWAMQMDSSVWAWLVGHGADRFVIDFAAYSRFEGIASFHSPHSTSLEMLYTGGVAGVVLFVGMYLWFVRQFASAFKHRAEYRLPLSCLAIMLFFHYAMISLTIPFYTVFNMYTLAFIAGVIWPRAEEVSQ